MTKLLKTTFILHAIIATLFGAPLLVAPGAFLQRLGWAPIDPILSRVLGAALLALAWSSLRGWRATDWAQIAVLVEMEIVYTVLGCIGLLRHLLFARYPAIVWLQFVLLAIFAAAWIASWAKPKKQG